MQELLAQLLLVLRGAWRYRWPALALTWVLALVGWLIVAMIPDEFEARTRIYVNTQSLLKPLLEGIAVDRDVVSEEGLHGPVVAAYRAMLAVSEHAHLGRHSWLLKEEEVAAVYNLRQAQRHLVRACASVAGAEPDLIAAALRHHYHWLAYWSFVLLYTSRHCTPGMRPMPIHR